MVTCGTGRSNRVEPTRYETGTAVSSFDRALPAPDSELVRDLIKDPYHFEFLSLGAEAKDGISNSHCSTTSSRSSWRWARASHWWDANS